METAVLLQSLRDPMGVPFYPWVFQALLVLTFALHIFFVNLVVGSLLVGGWGHFSRDDRARRLSRSLARSATINLSVAIVLGVAPLLFLQVIYDPFWYSATMLSASWSLVFLLAVTITGLALYAFYLRRRKVPERAGGFGLLALLAVLAAGLIMHVLAMQSLAPDQWQVWNQAGEGMQTAGWGWHAYSSGRLLHFLVPALVNTGILLMLQAWYLAPRDDLDRNYLTWVGRLGARLSLVAVLVQAIAGFWWLVSVPQEFHFAVNPWLMTAVFATIALVWLLLRAGRDPLRHAVPASMAALTTVLLMSGAREALRVNYLTSFNYSVHDYPVNLDWGSTLLFLATFLVGVAVLIYPLRIAFRAGRQGNVASR